LKSFSGVRNKALGKYVIKFYEVVLPFTQQSGCYILERETHSNYEFMPMALPIYPGQHRREVFVKETPGRSI
jgi:hypothetical protein